MKSMNIHCSTTINIRQKFLNTRARVCVHKPFYTVINGDSFQWIEYILNHQHFKSQNNVSKNHCAVLFPRKLPFIQPEESHTFKVNNNSKQWYCVIYKSGPQFSYDTVKLFDFSLNWLPPVIKYTIMLFYFFIS